MISVQAAKATEHPLDRAEQRWPESWSEWARVTQQDAEATMGTGGGGVGLPCSSGWEDKEATEDAIGLWAVVNAAPTGIFFNPDLVSLLEMQHRASRHHLQESLTVEVTEAQGLDPAPPRGPDGQAEVPLGHHLEGEIVVAWDRAVEPARVVLVHILLVGDDLSEDDHVVSRQRVRSHGREGWPRLVLDVSGVPFGALQPREARGPHGTSGSWVAHSAWISRGSRVTLVSFKATDPRLDGRGPCGEKVRLGLRVWYPPDLREVAGAPDSCGIRG